MSIDVKKIQVGDLDDAASALPGAFSVDPLFAWMARGRGDPGSRLEGLFRAVMRAEMRKDSHESYMCEGRRCAAVWRGIDDWKTPAKDVLRASPAFVRAFGLGMGRVLRTLSMVEKVHPTEPHYYLEFIGTYPSRQGTGLGSRVMQPMLERCDTEGVPAYLENSNPQNEAFYARHGFVATGPITLPKGAPPVTAMWREPRTT